MRALAAVLMLLPALAFAQQVPEPEGYRMEAYRAPVPETLAGAQVVDADEAHALWQSGEVAFVDVLPQPPKPDNLPEGTVWRAKPRDSIPGAVWLPNTGYGALAEEDAQYFRDGLAEVTGGDRAHPLLIFCLAECWMSWNAAKRALAEGYAEVYWLPVGTDGWAAAGYPLERVTPRQ
ncbi:PQQ-dependent catabolism-associated CXXCW motif protein [Alloyangia pacifica]|uniref:PQQ-dependent catabolism-associated CXXCW motif protein n=1 Tax=Alloyangia pacifica TaxID=311180 RepID=UPI001CD354B6|nr:PQQ-dependent catabolism-associated CXXCW motif protein [Alloyangia pacifica]MCA0997170.1 PQQ-dependent catabolism-associated CXXCW motif protein [Alloyangia pacifica]